VKISRAPTRAHELFYSTIRWFHHRLQSSTPSGYSFFNAPKGLRMVTGDMIPGGHRHPSRALEGRWIFTLSPQVSFIVFNATPSEEFHVLLLKGSLSMMLFLFKNVLFH